MQAIKITFTSHIVELHIHTQNKIFLMENATAKVKKNWFQSLVVRNQNDHHVQISRPCNISVWNVVTKERRRMML